MDQPALGLSTARRLVNVTQMRTPVARLIAFRIVQAMPMLKRRGVRRTSATRPIACGRQHPTYGWSRALADHRLDPAADDPWPNVAALGPVGYFQSSNSASNVLRPE